MPWTSRHFLVLFGEFTFPFIQITIVVKAGVAAVCLCARQQQVPSSGAPGGWDFSVGPTGRRRYHSLLPREQMNCSSRPSVLLSTWSRLVLQRDLPVCRRTSCLQEHAVHTSHTLTCRLTSSNQPELQRLLNRSAGFIFLFFIAVWWLFKLYSRYIGKHTEKKKPRCRLFNMSSGLLSQWIDLPLFRVHIYVCIYMRVCIYLFGGVYVCIYIYIYRYLGVYMYVYIFMCLQVESGGLQRLPFNCSL